MARVSGLLADCCSEKVKIAAIIGGAVVLSTVLVISVPGCFGPTFEFNSDVDIQTVTETSD